MKDYYKVNKFSASSAKVLASGLSPYAAFHKLRTEFVPTDSMKLGTIMHAIIEHGGFLPKEVAVVSPYTSYTTGEAKAFKAWWDGDKDFLSKLPKKDNDKLKESLYANIALIEFSDILTDEATISKAHKMAYEIMKATDTINGEHEKAYFTDDSKALMDFVTEDTVKDWKSTKETTMAGVLRECFKYGYHIQAAQYLKLSGKAFFELDFVSSVEPHEVFIVKAGDSFLDTGREKLEYAKGIWDQYHDMDLEDIPRAEPATIEDKFRDTTVKPFETEGEF